MLGNVEENPREILAGMKAAYLKIKRGFNYVPWTEYQLVLYKA